MIMCDLGDGFFGCAFENGFIKEEHGIKPKCEARENPQANSIL